MMEVDKHYLAMAKSELRDMLPDDVEVDVLTELAGAAVNLYWADDIRALCWDHALGRAWQVWADARADVRRLPEYMMDFTMEMENENI
jgi:hypothetical protein